MAVDKVPYVCVLDKRRTPCIVDDRGEGEVDVLLVCLLNVALFGFTVWACSHFESFLMGVQRKTLHCRNVGVDRLDLSGTCRVLNG